MGVISGGPGRPGNWERFSLVAAKAAEKAERDLQKTIAALEARIKELEQGCDCKSSV